MRKILFLILSFVTLDAIAQYQDEYPVNSGNGDKMMEFKNWPEAVRQFTALLQKEPDNLEYKYKLGKSYVYADIDKKKAMSYLMDLIAFENKARDFYETLAQAYFVNYEFDKSKEIYKAMVDSVSSNSKRNIYNKWIAQCDMSQKMLDNPISVEFENLGKNINSKAPDFFPIVKPDESVITYTTKREGVVGNLNSYVGYKTADIFTSKHRRNRYSKSRSIGNPNTYGNEFTAGRSSTGSFITYTVNSEDNFNDIFVSELGKRSYMPPKEFGSENVNGKTDELGSTLSDDGRIFYFSSNRDGGEGGFDIYYAQRLPDGQWSDIRNLGAPVNTPGDEMYPCFGKEDKILYFASNGHQGMGGLDLFKSTSANQPNSWNPPKNLGYPVNTPYDDQNISFAENERYAYMSKRFDDTFGDLDIYRLTFLNEKDDYSLVSGFVIDSDSVKIKGEVIIEIFYEITGNFVGSYIMNTTTSKYSAILAPGRYSVSIIGVDGYKDYEKLLVVMGKNDRADFRRLDLLLETQ